MRILFFLTAIMLSATLTFSQSKEIEEVRVEGGTFRMGNDYSQNRDERPEHKVTLNSFFMAKYEVNIELYTRFSKVIGDKPPEGKPNEPVTNLSWQSSIMFCNWLSSTSGLDLYYNIARDSTNKIRVTINTEAGGYRLPTEAEWEYAARGGMKSKYYAYSGSHEPSEVAWYMNNGGNRVHEVGQLRENELGVFDMTGNVSEWCYDWYTPDYYNKSKDSTNPTGPTAGVGRVCRGGNFMCRADVLRNTRRFNLREDNEDGLAGIRLVRNE